MAKSLNKVFIIGNSEEDSDWIKLVDGGKYRDEELKIHEELGNKKINLVKLAKALVSFSNKVANVF